MSETADKIAKILEDPESIKLISDIADSFMNGSLRDNETTDVAAEIISTVEDRSETNGDTSSILKMLHEIISGNDVENAVRLITALRPYMSANRRSSADNVLKWLRALKIFGNIDLSEISKLIG